MTEDILIDPTDAVEMNEEYITSAEYEAATQTVVRTIGRDAGCDVLFVGDEAKMGITEDGSNIVQLPSNPTEKKMTKKQYFIGQGYANHETLHKICTDVEGLSDRMKGFHDGEQWLTYSLAQAIEDVRIEKAGGQLYPGMNEKLDATAEFAAQHFLDMDADERAEVVKDFKNIGPLALTWEGRKRLGYTSKSVQDCIDTLPADVYDKVKKYADLVDKLPTGVEGVGNINRTEALKGSHATVDLAEAIAREIAKENDGKDGDGDGQGDGSGNGSGMSSAGGGGSQSGNGSDGTGGAPSGADGNGDGEGGSQGGGVGSGNSGQFIPQDQPMNPDMLAYVKDELTVDEKPEDVYRPYTRALDVWVKRDDKTDTAKQVFRNKENVKDYNKAKKLITGKLAVMQRKLANALHSAMDVEWRGGYRTGKLKVRGNASKILQRKENVYQQREGGQDLSAAVTMLIDASGSMSGSRIELAQQSAVALAEAIARVGVPLEILVFNTRHPDEDEVKNYRAIKDALDNLQLSGDKDMERYRGYARYEPISMYEVKSFDDNMNAARRGLGGINKMVASANCDGESLLMAWDRLRLRPEENKVLLVLSDGQPACYGDNRQLLRQHLRDVIARIGDEGGKCVGLGIESSAVEKYYPKYTVVNNLEDLTGVTIDNIARMLLGERFVVDNSKLMQADAASARKFAS
jgi:cobalamin biosynthesis protein CobT